MLRLGLRLTLSGGREALIRLLVTAAAVAVGVALLLGVLAEFHAFQANAGRQCWECTGYLSPAALPARLPAHGELWNDSADFYQGQTIERLDVAALGPGAPVPPGIAKLPRPGQYYASPALAALLRTVPADELGDRFPGKLAGTIGDAALTGPGELVAFVGYTPAALRAVAGTQLVTSISTARPSAVFTPFFRWAFAAGAAAVLFPVLILVTTATRLAAARREERLAALRLVGATPPDVRVIAAVEGTVTALAGTALGIAVFALVQPALATAAPIGTEYFASTVTPTVWGYAAMLAAVPVASALAALLSLRRVQVSPLGVSRRVSPPPPSPWRLTVLAAGVMIYVAGLLVTSPRSIGAPAYPGLLLIMAGLVVAGPWLTAASARLLTCLSGGASPLLAGRRLSDNPKAAFRSVTGLVLAVFLGTMAGVVLPAAQAGVGSPAAVALGNVLRDDQLPGDTLHCPSGNAPGHTADQGFCSGAQMIGSPGLSGQAAARFLSPLRAIPGTTVYPIYNTPKVFGANTGNVVSCAVIRDLAVVGQCPAGARAVLTDTSSLLDNDNPQYIVKPIAGPDTPAYPGSLSTLPLVAVLVRAGSPAALERARTYLATHTAPSVPGQNGNLPTPPRTIAEVVTIRTSEDTIAQRLIDAAVTLTLIVAGCSLAVAVGGGLVDRKRPFTLLRVSGVPAGALSRVVLMEAALPLAAATVIAAGIAYGTSVLAVSRLAAESVAIPSPGRVYYETLGAGLVLALLVILLTIPLLRRMSAPGNIRFE
jgi:hypothetical protein